ncbi:YdcF family protein [Nocardiopsis sp. N85]|uniref:YdcF family protein n=1 Tax=Nocardiopsis sp. N85 TaxID=3029400 RepID=UPI00237F5354|nr:YdcF family protein [Nocardiopsis sp. N85]MDE3724743.1 YdcF family protein [Nocardiopsis sp. N85]
MDRKRLLLGATLVGGALLWSEWTLWRVSREDYPAPAPHVDTDADEAIIVLGYPSRRGDRPGLIQRYRVRVAVRSRDPRAGRSVLIFTGGNPRRHHARRSEAAVMADYAVDVFGVDPADILLEEKANNTWENIGLSLPLAEPFPVVKIASNTSHARRGRRYLRKQAPEIADRLRPTRDHRPGELLWLKPLIALYRR